MQKQTVFWLIVKDTLETFAPLFTPEQHKWGKYGWKMPLVVPTKTIEMAFISGRGLGLHASTVLFEIIWSPLSSLRHLSSHQKVSSVSGQFFFSASYGSHLHYSPQKEGVYTKFIKYSHGFSFILLKLDASLWGLFQEWKQVTVFSKGMLCPWFQMFAPMYNSTVKHVEY